MHGSTPTARSTGSRLEKLAERRTELYLSLIGFDETIGQTIHARHEYAL